MDFWEWFWLILGVGALTLIVILLIFAIIEPGPLQKQRGFGRKQHPQDEPDEKSNP